MRNLISNLVLIILVLSALPVVFAGDVDSLQSGEVVEYFAVQGLSSTNVGGLICTNTTWTLAGSPYIVNSSSIVIGCNAKLTIEPGVQVKIGPTLGMVVGYPGFGNGTLVARGTEQLPIVFTSMKDPCDPCNPPLPGDWSRLHFTDLAVDAVLDANQYVSGSILEYVTVEYAGSGTWPAVYAEKSSPFLNHCQIRHNSYYGIRVNGQSTPYINITNCEVWENSSRGIVIENGMGHRLLNNNVHHNHDGGISFGSASNNTLTGNTVSNNTGMGISFDGSGGNMLTENNVLNNTGTGISFSFSSSNIFTGNTISNNTGTGIYFRSSGSNTLTENTISNNIGTGIYFNADWCYNSGDNTLTGNIISNNTGTGISFSGFYGDKGRNTLTGNTISNNTGGGIYFYSNGSYGYSGSNTLTGNTISNNTTSGPGGGIYLGEGSGSNTINGNTITNNMAGDAGGGIYFGSSGGSTLGGNNISDNTSGSEGAGIYLTASSNTTFSGNAIADNQISGLGTTGGVFVTGDSQYVSLAGDPSHLISNIVRDNDGYQIRNDNSFRGDGLNDVNAVYMNWGTCDVVEIQALIFDFFDNSAKAFVLFWPYICPGDFDMDGDVDWVNLGTFVDNWLRVDCNIPDWCEGADLDVSESVDFFDFAELANNWLKEI